MRIDLTTTGETPKIVEFYDFYAPSLTAGGYVLNYQAQVDGVGSDLTDHTQGLVVDGPQFALPQGDVHSVFPANNAVGQFERTIPMVVLDKRVLPWERKICDSDTTHAPWMALLVLQADEVTLDPTTNSPLITMSVEAFLEGETDIAKPAIDTAYISPEVLKAQVSTITLDANVFHAVVPRMTDLPYLAHVRSNDITNQALTSNPSDPGWFSVVMANRFPQSANPASGKGARNHAVLVSLEGWDSWLNETNPQSASFVQLAVLHYWSFGSIPDQGASFSDLAEHLAAPESAGSQALLLRAPLPAKTDQSAAATEMLERIADGYVPLASKAPSGENTFAWYRSPCTPVVAQPEDTAAEIWPTASAAMIYDETFGVFDHSYSAAWQIGRSIALADRAFSAILLQMRRNAGYMLHRAYQAHLSNPDAPLGKQLVSPHGTPITATGDALITGLWEGKLTSDIGELASFQLNKPDRPDNNWRHRHTPIDTGILRQFLARPDIADLLSQTVEPQTNSITDWLARLCLLENVPFSHLVPAQAMLPVESLRFFYLDEVWLKAAMSGAMSLGVQSSRDAAVQDMFGQVLIEAAFDRAGKLRSETLSALPSTTGEGGAPQAGLLLRSQLVSGWPGLEIKATLKGQEVNLVRLERLDQTTLIALFDDTPDSVAISEPYQGLRFGVDDADRTELRRLTAPVGAPLKKNFPASGAIWDYTRPVITGELPPGQGERVLEIEAELAPALFAALSGYVTGTALTPSEFAIQMVQAPESIAFETLGKGECNG